MKFSKIAATTLGLSLLAGLTVTVAVPAEAAAKRKRSYNYYGHEDREVIRPRARTRITVRPHSYLTAGTETKQYDEHYTDYAFPPGYSPFIDRNDPKVSVTRMPMSAPYDLPGPKY
jgi:hypothetical protein